MLKKKMNMSLKAVVAYALLLNAGAAFLWPLVTIYMHNYLHKSLTLAGIVLLVMSIAMIAGNYCGGYLYDKWSPYKTAIISVLVSTFGIGTLIFHHDWPFFAIMLIFIGFGDGACMTLLNSYAATIKNRPTRSVFNMVYIGTNLGVVIGTLLVGFLLKYGVTLVFVVALACYLTLFALTLIYFNISKAVKVGKEKVQVKVGKNDYHVMVILICLMILSVYLGYMLWESVISVHMTDLGISFEKYSLLWTLNGLMIVIGQPFVNRIGEKFKLSSQTYLGIFIFAVSFLGLIFAKSYSTFIVVMVSTTIGEMIGLPGIPAWIDSLSKPEERGKYQGLYNVFISLGRAIGPLYGGLVLEYATYRVLFLSATVLILFTLGLLILKNRQLSKKAAD